MQREKIKYNFIFVTIMGNVLIDRDLSCTISKALSVLPIVTLTGPRQSGKTTLCRKMFGKLPYVNMEDAATMTQFNDDPKAFLEQYPNGMIIDEAQRCPQIFSYLQVLVDEDRMMGNSDKKYIVTGSANFALLQNASQSMAGRTAVLTLLPLSTSEILTAYSQAQTAERIINGGYPAIWNNPEDARALLMSSYYNTYVERDLRQLINIKDLTRFHHFIRLCAGRIGTECNAAQLSVEVGVSLPTIQSWMSILEASYIIYRLPPYFANIGKRLAKTPKIYFYDTGLACWLMGIQTLEQLAIHPLRGNLFENMVINDMYKQSLNRGEVPNLFFYRDQRQHEVDLLRIDASGKIHAYEIKSGKTYRSDYFDGLHYLRSALSDMLQSTTVIYDGSDERIDQYDAICSYRTTPFF